MKQIQDSNIPISIFYSYSHKDKGYRDKLKTHLSVMRRQGLISEWGYHLPRLRQTADSSGLAHRH